MIDMISRAECDAVLFSHYHGDHIGLLGNIPRQDVRGRKIMLGMGLEARKVLIRIHKTLAGNSNDPNAKEHEKTLALLKDRSLWQDFFNKETFTIGDASRARKLFNCTHEAWKVVRDFSGEF